MKRRRHGKETVLLMGAMLMGMPAASCADLSLQDAIDMALEQNTSLRITQKNEDTAQAELDQAKIENGLQIKGSESLGATMHSSSEPDSSNNTLGVTASYPVYTSGKSEANIDSSKLGLEAAKLSTERSRETLSLMSSRRITMLWRHAVPSMYVRRPLINIRTIIRMSSSSILPVLKPASMSSVRRSSSAMPRRTSLRRRTAMR